MFKSSVICLVLLFPCAVSAETVLICRSSYQLVLAERQVPQKARLVLEHVVHEIAQHTDWKVISLSNNQCETRADLLGLKNAKGVDEAVLVKVQETSIHYEFTVHTTFTEVSKENNGTFTEALGAISQTVLSLLPQVELSPQRAEQPEPPQPPQLVTRPIQRMDRSTGLSPASFWVSLSITGAFTVTTGVLEIVGYSMKKDLQDTPFEERDRSDKKLLEDLRTTERVFLVGAIAGAVTTTILGFLTPFGRKKRNSRKVDLTVRSLSLCGDF